ncbi:MAG: AMP-binding protein [Saccharofermentanales bacterium]
MNFVSYLLDGKQNSQDPLIVSAKETIAYNEIYTIVEELASSIFITVGTGKNVLLLADNNPFFVSVYLAIMKSGNVVVPLDTKSSDKDIKYYVETCNFALYFVQEKYVPKVNAISSDITCVTENTYQSISGTKTMIPETMDDELAAIIFTSGSTGEKKGVMLSHGNLIANTSSIVEYLGLDHTDRICVILPFFYCYGLSLLHTHIKSGGSIVLSNHPFIGGALRDIEKYQCTGFAGVPSTYQILIANSTFLSEKLPSLRYFTQAGGKLQNNFIQTVINAFPDKKFIVMYGATEATARMSYLPAELAVSKLGSIGKGIPGVTLKVVADDHEVRPGETGEIIASGKNIMQGYFNDPNGTAEVLKEGWYHTGDLGTVDDDGFIYVVGRSKNIIKCGGFRVSPYEIEGEICKLADVEDAAVIGRDDDILGEAIVAFICSSTNDPEKLKTEIIGFCKRTFPSHKTPKEIHIMKALPLNSSNKVDREKLKHMVD